LSDLQRLARSEAAFGLQSPTLAISKPGQMAMFKPSGGQRYGEMWTLSDDSRLWSGRWLRPVYQGRGVRHGNGRAGLIASML